MHCHIEWNTLSLEEWDNYYSRIRRAPLLQSYDYAMSTYVQKGLKPSWGLIYIDHEKAGIVQIAKTSLPFNLFEIVILDMGPLWFENNQLKEKSAAFFIAFDNLYPAKINRKRRIIPYLEDRTDYKNIPSSDNYKSRELSYETIWMNLEQDIETLRKNLKQKWRNLLNKSEKLNLSFEADKEGQTLSLFKHRYIAQVIEKKYKNIPPKLLPYYKKQFSQKENFLIFYAVCKGRKIASALILIHGNSATYQIGLVEEEAKNKCANYFLIWNVILYLKNIGVKDFDLGGINAYNAKGIQHFKEGLNGQKILYKGIYS